jgi:hypothetical protein
MACTLQRNCKTGIMIEKQSINGKDVWLKVDPYHVDRENRNIIPTEYFTATYYIEEPAADTSIQGELLTDEEGETKLFESPVAALSYAVKRLQKII